LTLERFDLSVDSEAQQGQQGHGGQTRAVRSMAPPCTERAGTEASNSEKSSLWWFL